MKLISLCLFLLTHVQIYCQVNDSIGISLEEVKEVLGFLASDSLKGRANATKELQQAAYFIEKEFSRDSLAFFDGLHSFLQPFILTQPKQKNPPKDSAGHFLTPEILYNVIGVLPGKTLPGEAILFSAHYDHVGSTSSGKDKIFNGANDDASGITALLMIAKYFTKKRNNERTLIFCAFAGEELGLIGSDLFAKNINPKKIIAGINIEMIGIPQKGKNAFFITGSDLSNFGALVRKDLKGSKFKLVSKPALSKDLFRRSDNYSFAKYGIPAHTIMTSDDSDPCYHKPCDEASRIDFANMRNVIEAIIIGTRSLVDGTNRPH